MEQRTAFQQLNLNNAFLFSAALEQPDICRIILEIIFGCKMPKVKVHAEHSILISPDFRSVRLDIYASDETQVHYNLEAQNEHKGSLPKRSRYYQAEMDVSSLKPGDDFEALRPGCVIFICTFDPFDKGKYQYTFEERCLEENFSLGDGTKKIFLNTKGKNDGEVSQELVHFLKYMEESTDQYVSGITDESIIELHERIEELKKWRKLEGRYMRFEELLRDREKKGILQARQESIFDLLQDYGNIPQDISDRISKEKDLAVLKQWMKLAARSSSIEEFQEKM